MIAAEHPVVPHQSESPGDGEGKPPEDRRHVFKRRFITATIIVVLIGIPALLPADLGRSEPPLGSGQGGRGGRPGAP